MGKNSKIQRKAKYGIKMGLVTPVYDGAPYEVKISRTVRSGGKGA